MTPEEEALILALVTVPGRQPPMPKAEFLQRLGETDGAAVGIRLLHKAIDRRDADQVELALVVCFTFGFTDDHIAPLLTLTSADWHHSHEDVATGLGTLRSPRAIAALVRLAEWVPAYLAFDDARALATKSIWALGAIDAEEARRALASLTRSHDPTVAQGAKAQLDR